MVHRYVLIYDRLASAREAKEVLLAATREILWVSPLLFLNLKLYPPV